MGKVEAVLRKNGFYPYGDFSALDWLIYKNPVPYLAQKICFKAVLIGILWQEVPDCWRALNLRFSPCV